MKPDSTHAKKLAALLKKLKSSYDPAPPEPRDPVTTLVLAFLQWEATRRQAEAALGKIQTVMVDNNDLRISHNHEVVAIIGSNYPRAEERIARMHEALQEIYIREHAVTLDPLSGKSRKDIRSYLETLRGIPPYVYQTVGLLAFGHPSVPVDDRLLGLLIAEGALPEECDAEHAAAFIEKQVKADEALPTHLLMQAWSDDGRRGAKTDAAKKTKRPTKRVAASKKKK